MIFGDGDDIPYQSYIQYNNEYFQLSDSLQYTCYTTANAGPITMISLPQISNDTTSAGMAIILGEFIHYKGDSLKEEFYNTPINIFHDENWSYDSRIGIIRKPAQFSDILADGEIAFNKIGDEHEMVINATYVDGDSVSGYFKGYMKYIESE